MGIWKAVYTDRTVPTPKRLIDSATLAKRAEEAALRAFMKRHYPGRKATADEARDLHRAWQEQADFERKQANV